MSAAYQTFVLWGAATVEQETLSDGSVAFNVNALSEDGERLQRGWRIGR